MRLYLDTNIFIDYLIGRKDRFKDFRLVAFELLRRIVEERHELIVSNLLLKELEFSVEENKMREMFNWLNKTNKIIKIVTSKNDKSFAREVSKKQNLPYADCLHAVLAKNSKVDYLVTRNIKDFPNILKVILPESL